MCFHNQVSQNTALIAHLNRSSQPQRETFFNLQTPSTNNSLTHQSAVQLLFVSYDNADRPRQIKSAHHKFPTVRLNFVPTSVSGRITSVRFGDVESSWEPDNRGLLKLRNYADGRAYQFHYVDNSTSLHSVSAIGGLQLFNLHYDDQLGLQSIRQGGIEKFGFKAMQSLDFIRRTVTLPGFSDRTDIVLGIDRGLDFATFFNPADEKSLVTAKFSIKNNNLETVTYDGGSVEFSSSQLLTEKAISEFGNTKITSISDKKGTLLSCEVESSNSVLFSMERKIGSDIKISIAGSKNAVKVPANNLQMKVSDFGKIERSLVGNWTVLSEIDSHGRLMHSTVYEPNSRVPLVQMNSFYEIIHQQDLEDPTQSPWRITKSVWHYLPENELYSHSYEWTPLSQHSLIKSVKVERSLKNASPEKFGTSTGYEWTPLSGNLQRLRTVSTNNGEEQTTRELEFTTGIQDQLRTATTIDSISYDVNGCISQLGNRKFHYNHLRQLTKVDGTSLFYDAFGRLSSIHGNSLNIAIAYDKVGSPQLLTMANLRNGHVKHFDYNPITGCIQSVEDFNNGDQSTTTVILTDSWCTPMMGMKQGRRMIHFPHLASPGFVGSDNLKAIEDLIIGYHGFVQLYEESLIFFDQSKPFDSVTGRFLCPDFGSLLSNSDDDHQHSLAIGSNALNSNRPNSATNLYQNFGPSADRTSFHLLSLDELNVETFAGSPKAWLSRILAPVTMLDINENSEMSPPPQKFSNGLLLKTLEKQGSSELEVNSRAEMAYQMKLSTISSLSAAISDDAFQRWPIFVPAPVMKPIFGHPALQRVLLSSVPRRDQQKQTFELLVTGRTSNQHQSLLRSLTLLLNGTFYVKPESRNLKEINSFQFQVFKPLSKNLQSDIAALPGVTCNDQLSFGDHFNIAADCSNNVVTLQTSASHVFKIHYNTPMN